MTCCSFLGFIAAYLNESYISDNAVSEERRGSSRGFPQRCQSGRILCRSLSGKFLLHLQMFFAYLFFAIIWSLGLEGHGPSHEIVPEVRIQIIME